jgi:hypothetical protein
MQNVGGEICREKSNKTNQKEKGIESDQRTPPIIATKCTCLIRTNIVLITAVHLGGTANGTLIGKMLGMCNFKMIEMHIWEVALW